MAARRFRLFVELFAVGSGASFVISALLQGAILLWSGVDFFAVASIEDVVLGGMRLLALFIVSVAVCAPFLSVPYAITAESAAPASRITWRIRITIVGIITTIWIAALAYLSVYYASDILLQGFGRFAILSAALATWPITLCFLCTSKADWRSIAGAIVARWRRLLIVSSAFAIMLSVPVAFSAYSNVVIASRSALPSQCILDAGGSQTVVWIGSRAMVLECRWGTVAILNADQPVILQVGPQTYTPLLDTKGRYIPAYQPLSAN
jgi:hypothetical protein